MNRPPIAPWYVALLFSLALVVGAGTPPNILIILVDDMGYSDIGCYGGEIHTPNIDRLAAHGMKFAQRYNTAKCYPTRACLQTGVYFQRTDRDFSNTATLGEVLRPARYERQIKLGLVDPKTSPLPPMEYGRKSEDKWSELSPEERRQEAMRMYDMAVDRTETRNLAAQQPELVQKMDTAWLNWWKECTGKAWTGTAPKERGGE